MYKESELVLTFFEDLTILFQEKLEVEFQELRVRPRGSQNCTGREYQF